MSGRAILPVLLCVSLSISCDDGTITGMPLESAGKRLLEFRTVTQLLPNRPTHVAVNRLGHIFWVQETDSAQDVLFMSAEAGIPRVTRLSSANIIQALAEVGDDRGDGPLIGNIRDVVAAEGGIYFYFYGFRGNVPKVCLGQYLPQSGRIRILADTRRMSELTGMGQSLDLARATLVASGDEVYLWLRHSDASVFLSFDARSIPAVAAPKIDHPFRRIVSEGRALDLTRTECELSAGPGGTLFLLDVSSALLWQVEPTGAATARFSLIGLPRALSPPTAAGAQVVRLFAADSEPIGTELEILQRRELPKLEYPALLDIDGVQLRAIERDEFRAHSGFPVYAVRLGRLVPETPATYISYDSASGALMRVRIVETE